MKFSLTFIIGLVAFLVNLSGGMVWTKAALWGIAFWVGSGLALFIILLIIMAVVASTVK
ncbi:hypothetical protein [Yersinia phage MHG19]|nr:hypothetical protein [Yersinia phage MHG19]